MESYSQNSNKLDFQHEHQDIKRYMAHYRFRFGDNRRTGLGSEVSRNYGNKI